MKPLRWVRDVTMPGFRKAFTISGRLRVVWEDGLRSLRQRLVRYGLRGMRAGATGARVMMKEEPKSDFRR